MKKTLFLALLFFSFIVAGQDLAVSGNIEINSQLYNKDTIIDAPEVPEKFLTNIYAQINFNYKNFTAGFRYEAYQNALLGYDRRYNGQGLANKFVEYRNDFVTVTAGNFYEQFGNGLVLRSFEDRSLGYDNSFSGGRIILKPIDGIRLKALIGRQRFFWTLGDGIVRAFDAEANVNTALGLNMKPDITIGGSFVSKYQKDENPIFILPENVAAFAARTNVYYKNISLNAEYAYKINDPSSDNDY
ncbi:MAG: hypothetical protein GXO47_03845, partial [Chlorobi bacterium]|nr:hypothetical protein [Chlorobiota bacterium]